MTRFASPAQVQLVGEVGERVLIDHRLGERFRFSIRPSVFHKSPLWPVSFLNLPLFHKGLRLHHDLAMLADGLGAWLAADQAVMALLERPFLAGLLFWLAHNILRSRLHKN